MSTSPEPPPTASSPDRKVLAAWQHHWRDEADAAFLYRAIADTESNPGRRNLYHRFAEVEEHHTVLWRELLATHGVKVNTPRPSLRARVLAWIARRFGSSVVLPLLLREESREVKGYLTLYQESAGAAKDTAHRLARESAQHAEALGELAGTQGEPWHRTESGGFLRNIIYGFNDGLTANFGLVAGVIGAAVEPHIVIVSGVAGMIADALSMGSSGYLAAKSEQEVYAHEIAMEKEEIWLMPNLEEEELALIYEARGVEQTQAKQMAQEVMSDPERALDEKVREELRIGEAHTTPLKEGWITGCATAVGALIPVAPFLATDGSVAIWISFAMAMLSHLGVGAARSIFTGRGLIRSGIDMFVVGLGVAGVGYLIGDLVAHWMQ